MLSVRMAAAASSLRVCIRTVLCLLILDVCRFSSRETVGGVGRKHEI